jgi:hypothetical protein
MGGQTNGHARCMARMAVQMDNMHANGHGPYKRHNGNVHLHGLETFERTVAVRTARDMCPSTRPVSKHTCRGRSNGTVHVNGSQLARWPIARPSANRMSI